jgi:hypothetical protein
MGVSMLGRIGGLKRLERGVGRLGETAFPREVRTLV